jgi:REP element-mobilizing transposase RayT
MPRAPRIDIPGLIYHVTSRGVKQLPIFVEEVDHQHFLRLLSLARDVFPFRLHAYSLMTNHYHLLLQTLDQSLSKTMQYFKTCFAKWHNRKYGHGGHVFQGRFHSIPVEQDAYFTTVARYIHLNPVRAGMVKRPEDYAWSNYGRLVRGEADPFVDPSLLLGYFGSEVGKQREKYRRYVEEGLSKPEVVTERILKRLRCWGKPPVQFAPPLSQILQ